MTGALPWRGVCCKEQSEGRACRVEADPREARPCVVSRRCGNGGDLQPRPAVAESHTTTRRQFLRYEAPRPATARDRRRCLCRWGWPESSGGRPDSDRGDHNKASNPHTSSATSKRHSATRSPSDKKKKEQALNGKTVHGSDAPHGEQHGRRLGHEGDPPARRAMWLTRRRRTRGTRGTPPGAAARPTPPPAHTPHTRQRPRGQRAGARRPRGASCRRCGWRCRR